MLRFFSLNRRGNLAVAAVLACCLVMGHATPVLAADEERPETVEVRPGDSLYKLVRAYFPEHSSAWTLIMHDIVRLNPDAFRNGDPASLRVGATLKLPEISAPEPRAPMPVPEPEPEPVPEPTPELVPVPLTIVGEVADVTGEPVATDLNGNRRVLTVQGRVHSGDTLDSTDGGSARLVMNDGAAIHLRPFSTIAIEQYDFTQDHPEHSRSIINLIKGGLRMITGLIGRSNPQGFRVDATVATIGVRGTDFGLRVCGAEGCRVDGAPTLAPGAYTGVLDGGIGLSNRAGNVAVGRGEFYYVANADAVPSPAPDAAAIIFSKSELAVLEPQRDAPMGFLKWLRYRLFGED